MYFSAAAFKKVLDIIPLLNLWSAFMLAIPEVFAYQYSLGRSKAERVGDNGESPLEKIMMD